jgi:hypothetical protein
MFKPYFHKMVYNPMWLNFFMKPKYDLLAITQIIIMTWWSLKG